MSINCTALRWGGLALAGVGLVGSALNDYAKMLDPLSENKFDAFVLQTTATSSAAYDGVGQAQCTITGNMFEVAEPKPDWRWGATATDASTTI